MKCLFVFSIFLALFASPVWADPSDDFANAQTQIEEALLDSLGGRFDEQTADNLRNASDVFARNLTSPAAKAVWSGSADAARNSAEWCGELLACAQHALAIEMLAQQRAGNIAAAKEWRALIALPRHASSVEGALALQRLGANGAQGNTAVTELLAKEYIMWQTARIREKLDSLRRTVDAHHASAELVAARLAEMRTLANFPADILKIALASESASPETGELVRLAKAGDWQKFSNAYANWRTQLESTLPNLLSAQEVARQERLLLKLVALMPKEYKAAGIYNGNITVPLEYHHTQGFLIQAEQLVNELSACWRTRRAEAYAQHLGKLRDQLDNAEQLLAQKVAADEFEDSVKAVSKTLADDFKLSLAQDGANGVEEIALEIHTALSAALAAAQAGKWQDAEAARLDAYTSFDLTIEKKVLPRDPELAIRAERSFLDGDGASLGIKTALDKKLRGAELEKVFQRTLADLAECQALLKVAVSPATISFTTATVVMREGLEAVVILAAILAGLRGTAQERQRKGLIRGAWVAVLVTVLTFWLSRTLIQSLAHYGEKLEAVISILAVLVLLMVTNWVFHKVYWVQWNTKLRHFSNAVKNARGSRWEWLGLIGVGFLTIYREGFETTLFLQSLILEGGIKAVSIGFSIGLAFIAIIGFAVFKIGAKLPYRKMLVVTGLLVVSILITFLGSTVRLFQTVGWLPIHPIASLHIPAWMGTWLGLFPSWEGMLIPPAGLIYVGGAWLYTKIAARLKRPSEAAIPQPVSQPVTAAMPQRFDLQNVASR